MLALMFQYILALVVNGHSFPNSLSVNTKQYIISLAYALSLKALLLGQLILAAARGRRMGEIKGLASTSHCCVSDISPCCVSDIFSSCCVSDISPCIEQLRIKKYKVEDILHWNHDTASTEQLTTEACNKDSQKYAFYLHRIKEAFAKESCYGQHQTLPASSQRLIIYKWSLLHGINFLIKVKGLCSICL